MYVCACVCHEIVSRNPAEPQNQMRSNVGCFRLPSLRWRQIFAKINRISSTDHASLNTNLYQLHTIQYCRQKPIATCPPASQHNIYLQARIYLVQYGMTRHRRRRAVEANVEQKVETDSGFIGRQQRTRFYRIWRFAAR